MEDRLALIVRRNRAFFAAAASVRLGLALAAAFLILLVIGADGEELDYYITFGYLVFSTFFLILPPLRELAKRPLFFPLLAMDLAVAGVMISRSGGVESPLYLLLLLPTVVAAGRFRYIGALVWASMMALIFTISAVAYGEYVLLDLVVRLLFIYLLGLGTLYLVRNTYRLGEEPEQPERSVSRDLKGLDSFLSQTAHIISKEDNHDTRQLMESLFHKIIQLAFVNINTPLIAIMVRYDDTMQLASAEGWLPSWIEAYQKHPLDTHESNIASMLVFKNHVLIQDIKEYPQLAKAFDGIPVASFFAFPLIIENEVAGALVFCDQKPHLLSEREIQLAQGVCLQGGIIMQSFLERQRTGEERQKAIRDGLTGLFNRRFFNDKIDELVKNAKLKDRPLSLIMLDLDNFKNFNDTQGHPAGDQLLRIVAQIMSEKVRARDIVARYGGEEFVILLEDTDSKQAIEIAVKICKAISLLPPPPKVTKISASLGVAALPEHTKEAKALLEYADKSLYKAKQVGKNRVNCGDQSYEHD